MTNYLKAEKAVYRNAHPFRNYRMPNAEEKQVKKLEYVGDKFRSEGKRKHDVRHGIVDLKGKL